MALIKSSAMALEDKLQYITINIKKHIYTTCLSQWRDNAMATSIINIED